MCKKCGWIIVLIAFVATIAAGVAAFFVIKEKQKRDEEELEEYLDCSIQ